MRTIGNLQTFLTPSEVDRLVDDFLAGFRLGLLSRSTSLVTTLCTDRVGSPLPWCDPNPNLVGLLYDIEEAALTAIRIRTPVGHRGLTFTVESGIMFIALSSGKRLAYVQPSIGENQWGNPSIIYWGVGTNKKWQVLETYGGKLVENIVQAIARDLLTHALHTLDKAGHRIVMNVYDEAVIDEPKNSEATVNSICMLMAAPPTWARSLPLDADGYECAFYMKD